MTKKRWFVEVREAAMTARLDAGAKIASSAWHEPAKTELALRDHFFIFKFSATFILYRTAKSLAKFGFNDENEHEKYLLII